MKMQEQDARPVQAADAAARRPRERFLLVHNARAGIEGRPLVERVVAALELRGATVSRAATQSEHELAGIIASAGRIDAAIAAGGDGTVRALAAATGAAGTPIGIIPVGTGNVLAVEIGLPKAPEAIAEVLREGPELDVEGGMANGAPFFLMAGAGIDGEIVARLSARLKRRLGKAAYVPATLAALSRPQPGLKVVIDGVEQDAGWVVVTRIRRYGGPFVMAPQAGLLQPGLTAVLFRSQNRLVRIAQMLALAARQHQRLNSVELVECRSVSVRSTQPVAVEVDGDVQGTTPLVVTFGGPRLRLIVPHGFSRA